MRLLICVAALCFVIAFQGCATSRPRGCGCGLEEHMGHRS